MKAKLNNKWQTIKDSFWFLPTVLAFASLLLAILMLFIDEKHKTSEMTAWALSKIGPEGVRAVLSVVASSIITITGVVFSITIVALTLAASQLSPRILRNYMKNTSNQLALGTFVATYLYSLIVLVRINDNKQFIFVPYLSFTVGILLAIFSLGMLIFFIHHISVSIQADYIIGSVSDELNKSLKQLFRFTERENKQQTDGTGGIDEKLGQQANQEVTALKSGYIQTIDTDRLIEVADECNAFLQLKHRPGDFVISNEVLARVYCNKSLEEDDIKSIRRSFIIGRQRGWEQDVEFSVNQVVEIALRALSSGINDTFTALACIDKLSIAVSEFIEKGVNLSPYLFDENGKARIYMDVIKFEGFTDAVFNKIRQSAGGNPAVLIRMLERLADLASRVKSEEQNQALLKHATMIKNAGLRSVKEKNDCDDINDRFTKFEKALAL